MKYLACIFIFVKFMSFFGCENQNNLDGSISLDLDTTIVDINGTLRVMGNKIVNKHSQPISLAGNSFFWSNNNWGGERFYNSEVVSWLKEDWNSSIVRASMGIEEPGGYLDDKKSNEDRIRIIIDAAIEQGIYVIIDWHSHHAEDYEEEAKSFFEQMALAYGAFPNVIYEIYNEPLNVSWSNVIKPYAISVISIIREIDPDNLIIVGTPNWSQRVDMAAQDPIVEFENIAYTLHFYTIYHKQELRDIASDAINSGLPLFVTEWGSIGYSLVDLEANKWMTWCFQNSISHCNWSVNDKEEAWSIVKPGAPISNWSDTDLTEAGQFAKNIIKNWLVN